MKLTDMKITAEEQRERDAQMNLGLASPGMAAKDHYRDRYPYGLELRLDNETIEKLGLDKLPTVGKRVRIEAVAIVSGAHVNETSDKDGKKHNNRSLELQIHKLAVNSEASSMEEAIDDGIDDADDRG